MNANPYEMSSENIVETGSRLVSRYGWRGAIDTAWQFRQRCSRLQAERKFWVAVEASIRDVMPEVR